MDRLLGYTLRDELFRSIRTVVYRSKHPETGRPVILKLLRDPRPPRERVLWFKREYALLRHLDGTKGVVQAIELGKDLDHWVMVQEDIGGQSLRALLAARPLRIEEFLEIASRVAGALARVHAADVIHKDINPGNIVFNRTDGQLRLIDFGISTQLSRETARFESPTALEGTLAYVSPEQTGRMNRSLDHRTDLYSLGVTFYELLTSRTPFDTADPVALIHAHIARVPPTVAETKASVPLAISRIVEKLMAKAPEGRYQSAIGLRADLDDCLRQFRETGEIEPFQLDRHHTPTRLILPEKLYGRGAETERLMRAFERAAKGPSEIVYVAGYSGVGKSSLVHELYRPITERRGFFVTGKFDQLRRETPYAVIIRALQDLTRVILTEPQAQLDRWREALHETLGDNGQLLLDVIPELSFVMGPQPALVGLSAAETRNRLQLVFTRFLQVFSQAAHPFTLFLDDLQWVDAASLALIESVLAGGQVTHLLVIAAYRENEVSAGHPLRLTQARLARAVPTETIALEPLEQSHIADLIADTTGRDAKAVRPLARLVVEKTHGNPYFARAFLETLYARKLLRLEDGVWTWDRSAVRKSVVSDNVVELVSGRLRALAPETQRILQVAGTLGNQFELETLAVADQRSSTETWKALWPAVEGGFLIVLSDAYKLLGIELDGEEESVDIPLRFAHDRVQQASYALVPETQRARASWSIGQRMLKRWPTEAHPDRLFEIVGHLNEGRAVAPSQDALDNLASLNLEAALRAHRSAAFQSAYEYARTGIELLGEDAETRCYSVAMPLLTECVETAYLCADYEGLDGWFDRAVAAAQDVLDTAWVHEIKTEAYNAQGRPLDALSHALDFLEKLGIECPREPTYDDVVAEMAAAAELLQTVSIGDLEHADDIEDPAVRIAVGLICKIYSSAYVASPFVFAVITLRQFQLVVKHGNCNVSALSYAVYGLLLAGLANDVKGAYAFGALSSRMLGRPDIKRFEAQALHLFNCHTRMWSEHLQACADGERRAYHVGLETGEMEFGCYGAHVASKYALFHGHDLESLRAEMEQYTAAMRRYRQDIACSSHLPWHQAVINLTQSVPVPHRLAGAVLDARGARPALESVNDRMSISNALTAELLLAVIFERFHEAVSVGTEGNGYLDAVLSQFNQPLHLFLDALARLSLWHESSEAGRPALRSAAEASLESIRGWSNACPINFAQKVALLEAELLAIDGEPRAARERFDDAIELSRRNRFLLDEALCYEAAVRFHTRAGRTTAARHYREDAHTTYLRWGAMTKVEALETEHPALRPQTEIGRSITLTRTEVTPTAADEALDLEALVRAAQAISSEVVLDRLLRRLLTILMENAGASRAVLVLIVDGVSRVHAEGRADGEVEVLSGYPLIGTEGQVEAVPESLFNYALRSGEPVVAHDALEHHRFQRDPYVVRNKTRSAFCVPIKNQGRTTGVIYLENDQLPGAFSPGRTELVTLLAGQIAVSIDNAQLYANLERRVALRTEQLEARNTFIREVFGRYMSDDVVDTLLESRSAQQIGGETRVLTLMFTDLRGFTAMCETLTAEQAVRTLNNYLKVMTTVIHRHGGNINNIMGDGLLVVFGAPIRRADHMDRAVLCALEMQLAMRDVNSRNASEALPLLAMGIGMHTGDVVVGNIGSEERAKYSVIGRNANLASRVETHAVGGQTFITAATQAATNLPLRLDDPQVIHPKGVEGGVTVYRVIGVDGRPELEQVSGPDRRVALEAERTVVVRLVSGKAVSRNALSAQLIAVGERSVELRLSMPIPLGTDLVVESRDGLVYARVTEASDVLVATVTAGRTESLR